MLRTIAGLSIGLLLVAAGCGRAGPVSRGQNASAPRQTVPSPNPSASPTDATPPGSSSPPSQSTGGTSSPASNPNSPCTGVTLTPSAPSPQPLTSTIVWTAVAVGCSSPIFEFWEGDPQSGVTVVVHAWSSDNTYSWDTGGGPPGTLSFEVEARHDNTSDSAEATATQAFTLVYAHSTTPCTAASLLPLPPFGALVGGTVFLGSTVQGCPHPQYRFTSDAPGFPGGTWSLYSSIQFILFTAGEYTLTVDARELGDEPVQATASIPYTIATPCAYPTLTASPPSPQQPGTTVTFTSSTSGCTNPEFRFWYYVGTSGTLQQDWSTNPSTTVATSSSSPSTFSMVVQVRQAVDGTCQTCFEAQNQLDYTLGTPPP